MSENISLRSVNQEKSQQINRSLVINLLRQEEECSRAQLAQLSGLRQATITNIIGEFIECGLVVETGLMSGSRGRRSIGLRLNDPRYKVIGVRMTRSAFYVCLAGISGKIERTRQFSIASGENVQITIERIRAALRTVLEENKNTKIGAVCMAMPGPYREDLDRLLFVTELSGWQNFPIKAALTKDFDIPICIVNDANASAFAQMWYHGKERGVQNMAYVLAGQGVGCGMIADGKLVLGHGGIAGEIGHHSINFNGPRCECGNHGCLEKYCSFLVLCENISQRLRAGDASLLREDDLTCAGIAQTIAQGDAVAREEYENVCRLLSIGIINLINQFNPGLVVIGDELAQIAPELLLRIVRENVRQSVNPLICGDLSIEINDLQESPSLLGAAAFAANCMLANPSALIEQGQKP